MLKRKGLSMNNNEVVVKEKSNPLKDAFGKLREFKAKSIKSTEDILKEVDGELEK